MLGTKGPDPHISSGCCHKVVMHSLGSWREAEHLGSASELKPTVFMWLDVSWVTWEHLHSMFHSTVRGVYQSREFLFSLFI